MRGMSAVASNCSIAATAGQAPRMSDRYFMSGMSTGSDDLGLWNEVGARTRTSEATPRDLFHEYDWLIVRPPLLLTMKAMMDHVSGHVPSTVHPPEIFRLCESSTCLFAAPLRANDARETRLRASSHHSTEWLTLHTHGSQFAVHVTFEVRDGYLELASHEESAATGAAVASQTLVTSRFV